MPHGQVLLDSCGTGELDPVLNKLALVLHVRDIVVPVQSNRQLLKTILGRNKARRIFAFGSEHLKIFSAHLERILFEISLHRNVP